MKRVLRILSYVLVAVLASGMTFGVMYYRELESSYKLQELSELIQDKFIGEEDVTAMEDAAAAAMVASLGDRWSHYITAEGYDDYRDQMNNSYVGVGITVTKREDGYIDIVGVSRGGPAEGVGILPGDILTHADGQDLSALTMDESTSIIKGEKDTVVKLTVRRGEEVLDFDVTRAYFEVVVAEGQMLQNGVGLVTIENFDKRCADETIAAIEELLDQGAAALIFDVRNNPGGYVTELVEVLDYLLPEGLLFRSEYYNGKVEESMSDAECLELPMAVLVNAESYSAAEFFAAALEEYDAAIVVGEKTVGKGYFQQTYRLSDGSAVGLSVGRYTTPKGVNLAGVGITPEVEVQVDQETFLQIYYGNLQWQEDPQILAALEALGKG